MNLTKTVIVLAITCIVSLAIGALILSNVDWDGYMQEKPFDQEITFDNTKNISKISIDITSTDINIIPIKEDKINVQYKGMMVEKSFDNQTMEVPKLIVKKDGENIIIEIENNEYPHIRWNTFYSSFDSELNVYIPETYVDDLIINSVSSDVEVRNLTFDELDVEVVSGDINLEKISVNNMIVETVSGDITANDVSGKIDFNTVSGDVVVDYVNLTQEVKIETTSGDVVIDLPADGGKISYKTTSGDFTGEGFYGTFSDNDFIGKLGDNDNTIYVDTVSGDLSVSK